MNTSTKKYWLLKAEPETRIVKGKDVKFSVDDFERVMTSPWEGVRNYEARNLMKEMKKGEKALFYHSNCKSPGIAAFAQVSKEAYPDYTAWDTSHPYYDSKSNSQEPKWFMIDLTFTARAAYFVPLALLRFIADLPPSQVPEEIAYLAEEGINAIKGMDLVTRGRLSVQRVGEDAWEAIGKLAEKGGWEGMGMKLKKKSAGKGKEKEKETEAGSNLKSDSKQKPRSSAVKKSKGKRVRKEKEEDDEEDMGEGDETKPNKSSTAKRKRANLEEADVSDCTGLRRSTRAKK